MTKTQIPPPARVRLGALWCIPGDDRLLSAWNVLDEVGSGYRRRGRVGFETQRDLLRHASIVCAPVYVAVARDQRPYPVFRADMVADWLEAGGRSWIIAELEALAAKRVVPFPGRRA